MRIVLDSNVLLVAVGKHSRYRPIWNAFLEGRFQLLVSEEIIHEYEEILSKYSAKNVANLVMEIFLELPGVIYHRIYHNWNAITKDPDDNKFFDVAVAGNADHIVTNDTHFNVIGKLPFPLVKVISAEDLLDILKS